MMAQAEITNSVIDGTLRLSQGPHMLTHDDLREELIRQIETGKVSGADVARKLGIAPARVTEMKKRTRMVQQSEMPVLAQLLGLAEDVGKRTRPVEREERIPYLGRVAQGVWMEESPQESDPDAQSFVIYDRMVGDPGPADLFAVTPVGTSMNLAFLPKTQLICRRIPFGSGSLNPGDYVIAERTAHELHELTCKRFEVDKDGVAWLHSESDDERYQKPWPIGRPDKEAHGIDVEVRIVAKVIRAVRDFEREPR